MKNLINRIIDAIKIVKIPSLEVKPSMVNELNNNIDNPSLVHKENNITNNTYIIQENNEDLKNKENIIKELNKKFDIFEINIEELRDSIINDTLDALIETKNFVNLNFSYTNRASIVNKTEKLIHKIDYIKNREKGYKSEVQEFINYVLDEWKLYGFDSDKIVDATLCFDEDKLEVFPSFNEDIDTEILENGLDIGELSVPFCLDNLNKGLKTQVCKSKMEELEKTIKEYHSEKIKIVDEMKSLSEELYSYIRGLHNIGGSSSL